ncbi:MAG: hypothetical protein JXR73_16280 [Candidatus Omnitrophica bacterium]|nr:hypothetical protein [Candidatus Omnitrophota bacterium]
MNNRYLLLVIASLLICMAGAWSAAQEEASGDPQAPAVPEALQKQLAALLPDAQAMKAKLDGPMEYYGENLYELINGAAGIFHDYDFAALGHANYVRGESDITVDIYDMGDPMNAFGVFSVESSPDYNYIEIGAAGYMEEGILNFLQDRYYVKLSAYGDDDEQVKAMLKEFAEDVSSRIEGGDALPRNLRLFPKKNLIAHSQGYSKKAPLGYQFLAPALTADYSFGEEKTTVALSIAQDKNDALERVKKMREQVVKNGEASDFEAGGSEAFRGKDKYRGEIIGFALQGKGRSHYAVFIINPPEKTQRLIQRIQNRILPPKKN